MKRQLTLANFFGTSSSSEDPIPFKSPCPPQQAHEEGLEGCNEL